VGSIVKALISWGPLGVLILAALDSAGIPLPAGVDALLIAVAAVNPGVAYLSALLGVVGSAAGNLFLFLVARKGGELYLDRHTQSERARRFRLWFQRYGLLTVFIPALVPIPLPMKVFVLSAGALGVSPKLFLAVVLAARVPRYLGLAYLGARLGEGSTAWLRGHAWHLAGFAAGLFVVLFALVKLVEKRRSAASESGTMAL